jgi:lipoprotein-anchoring transpeptidase ErfK/SrfK
MYKKQSLLLSVLFLLTAMSCAYADSPAAKAKGSAPLAVKTAPAVTAKTTTPAVTAKTNAPAVKMKKVPQTTAVKKAPLSLAAEMALPVVDIDESYDLPEYPMGARVAMGQQKTYTIGEEDTVLDVARYFGLGFVETRAANPELDPWTAVAGEKVLIPGFKLLPRTRQDGVVVNLAQMRMYYFRDPGREPVSFPIGIGREGLQTPTGDTTIVRKVAGPVWFPTARMREGITDRGELLRAKDVKVNGPHSMNIILTEGKKHQIRRMLGGARLTVQALKRVRIMDVHIGNLKPGQARALRGAAKENFLRDIGL